MSSQAPFHLGTYLGEHIGRGLQGGFESALSTLAKKPQTYSYGDVAKLIDTGIKQFGGKKEDFLASPEQRIDLHNRIYQSLAQNPGQDPYLVMMNELNRPSQGQQQQGQAANQQDQTPQGKMAPPALFAPGPEKEGESAITKAWRWLTKERGPMPKGQGLGIEALEHAFRSSQTGKLFGAHNPERLAQLAEQHPEEFNNIMQSVGSVVMDAPLYTGLSYLLGPMGAMVATPALSEAGKHAWELARKEGPITQENIDKAVKETVQEVVKGAAWAGFAGLRPLQKILTTIPGGKKILDNSIGRIVTRVAEMGPLATTAVTGAVEKRLPTKEEIARNSLLALGFELGDLPAPYRKGTEPSALPPISPTPPPGAAMKAGKALADVQAAQAALQRGATASKSTGFGTEALGTRPQARMAPNVPPGSEAVGTVSRTVEAGPPEAITGRTISREAPVSPTIPEQQRAAIQELQQRAAKAPRPQGGPQELEPLQEAGRMAQMRGEPVREVGPQEMNVRRQPETLMAEQAKIEALNKKVAEFDQNLRKLRDLRKRRLEVQGAEREAVDGQIKGLQEQIKEQQRSLRKLAKEVETGKPSLQAEEVANATAKLRQRIVKEALEPTQLSAKQHAQKLLREQRRKDAIEKAKSLKGKDDGLPPDYADSFTRIHEAYINEYNNLIKNAEKQIAELKGDTSPEGIQERKVAEKIRDIAKEGLEKAQADLTNHRHSKGAQLAEKTAEKTAQVKQRAKTEKKVEKAAQKSRKEMEQIAKDYAERPNETNTKKVADAIGVKPEEVKQATHQAEEAGKKAARRVIEFRRDRAEAKEEAPKTEAKAEEPKVQKAQKKGLGETLEEVKRETAKKEAPKTESERQERLLKERMRRARQVTKEFFQDLRKGKLSAFWHNPLGRAIAIQSGLTAFDEIVNVVAPDFKKFPKVGLITLLLGGRNAGYRIAASSIFNAAKFAAGAVSTRSDINSYKEALKSHDTKKIIETGRNLTPKQKKQAQSEVRG